MDDGQIFIEANLVDSFLCILDQELDLIGATRGTGDDMKSIARLIVSENAIAEYGDGWITDDIRASCKLPGNNSAAHLLGADIGGSAICRAQFAQRCEEVAQLRDSISSLGESSVELVLSRRCACFRGIFS